MSNAITGGCLCGNLWVHRDPATEHYPENRPLKA
jgi:hypothetical protein